MRSPPPARAQADWAEQTPVERGNVVREIALALRDRREELSDAVAAETGKPPELALGETDAAVEMGLFVAGEGRRSYGRTMPASAPHRTVLTVRAPVGVAGLIISFNTPLPNVAWKAFPSILCGNGSVLKPSEHAPASAHLFARGGARVRAAGRRPQRRAGARLGGRCCARRAPGRRSRQLHRLGGDRARWSTRGPRRRLAKVCLELGGKNALVVCDDADLDLAVHWAAASAFSNAGQRCAAASRIVVFDAVYDEFRRRFVEAAATSPPQPVISEESLERILLAVRDAGAAGATVLCGGERLDRAGWHLAPTVVEGAAPDATLSCTELFGPVAALYRVRDLAEALALVNDSPFGLTAAIHTASLHRAMRFAERAQAGVVVVNGGTHGSEPHMGFGGVKQSGTGWKEAGVEALDVYSDVRYVNLVADPARA